VGVGCPGALFGAVGEEYPPPHADWPTARRTRTSAASSILVKMFFMFAPFRVTFLPSEKSSNAVAIDRSRHAKLGVLRLKPLIRKSLRITQKRINERTPASPGGYEERRLISR
jgi:hypothetical protein